MKKKGLDDTKPTRLDQTDSYRFGPIPMDVQSDPLWGK